MDSIGAPEWSVALTTMVVVAAAVVFHFEVIAVLNRWASRNRRPSPAKGHHRPTLLIVMFVLVAAHIAEIWLFGSAF